MGRQTVTERRTLMVAAAPILCGIHCAAGPLLVVVAPALAPTPVVEWSLFGVTLAVAAGLLARRGGVCWRRWDGRLLVSGAAVWAGSLAGVFEPIPEVATTIVGTAAVAIGLLGSLRTSRRGRCDCGGCESRSPAADPTASGGWRGATPSPRAR